jgi:hypothetical protein
LKIVLWSDKTNINIIRLYRKVYVWKKRGEFILDSTTSPTVGHGEGNNLMVWGCMSWNSVRILIEVKVKMDADQYCQIWGDGMVETFEILKMEEGEWYFQQDNTPKHTS